MPRRNDSVSDTFPNSRLQLLAELVGIKNPLSYSPSGLIRQIVRETEIQDIYRVVAIALGLSPDASPTPGEMELCVLYGTSLCHPVSGQHEPVLAIR